MKILVTGGCGFIGSHLVEYLHSQGHQVSVIDNLSNGTLSPWNAGNTFVADCQNRQQLLNAAEGCDYIYHCASTVGVQKVLRDPASCIRNIYDSTKSVLSLGVPGMYFSTSEVYGKAYGSYVTCDQNGRTFMVDGVERLSENSNMVVSSAPRWSYACAKLTGEWLALDEGWQVVRLFNVVGPRQNPAYGAVLPRFVQQALNDEPLTVYGNGKQVRTFTSVHDVVRILDQLRDGQFDVVNVGSTNTVSIEDLAGEVIAHTSKCGPYEFVPYEKAYPPGFEETPSRIPDLTKLHQILGVQQYKSLETIIKEMEKHYGQAIRKRLDDPVANLG